jgi:hypothetical protein
VQTRFDGVTSGQIQKRSSGWPETWVYETSDRTDFVQQIRWFSSNYWPEFGRLLTPLVQGIRVRGPLYPNFAANLPRLVLLDGQGLGHTPDSSSSVTTHITRRFPHADVILLVDNAQQPMQAAPLSVLRAVASSGHHPKLAIAFTHFDQIKGTSLPTFDAKKAHVIHSVTNALSSLRDVLGAPIAKAIERELSNRCFMLGGVDRQLDSLPQRAAEYMATQLNQLIEFCQNSILPPPPPAACPSYDSSGIGFAVHDAVTKFVDPWIARLGISSHPGVHREHWTRIKALTRRVAGWREVEYDSLKPVADLVARLTEAISLFLDKPLFWNPQPKDEVEAEAAISEIRRAVALALHEVAIKRLIDQHLSEWREAYDGPIYRGPGSTYRRARALRSIYEEAAPLPGTVMSQAATEFLAAIRRIVETAILEAGARIVSESDMARTM